MREAQRAPLNAKWSGGMGSYKVDFLDGCVTEEGKLDATSSSASAIN